MKRIAFLISIIFTFAANGQSLSEEDKEARHIADQIIDRLDRELYLKVSDFFSDTLKSQFYSSKIESAYLQVKKSHGKFENLIDFTKKVTAENTFYIRGMQFTKSKLDFVFSLDSNKKLLSFNILPYIDKTTWKAPSYANDKLFEVHDIRIGEELPLLAKMIKTNKTLDFIMVVMVHGSGPNDMYETLGPNKLFKDLSYGLGSNKISSIIYNKRTYDYPSYAQKKLADMTIDDIVVDDAVLAVKKAREMGASKVILIGHSLGGHMAPKIAETAKPDGVILLAANASPLEDLIIPQIEYIMANDTSSNINEIQFNAIKFQVDNLKSGNFDEETSRFQLPFSLPGKFWQSLKGYEPTELSKKQDIPYLVLNGERDYQVTPKEAKKWKNGNKHELSKTIIYPKLNHFFFAGEGILLPAEYNKEDHLDEQVLNDIISWIKAL